MIPHLATQKLGMWGGKCAKHYKEYNFINLGMYLNLKINFSTSGMLR